MSQRTVAASRRKGWVERTPGTSWCDRVAKHSGLVNLARDALRCLLLALRGTHEGGG